MASLTNGNEVKLKMINGDKVGLAPHPHIQVQPQVQQVQPPQAIFILQPPSSVSNQQSMHTFQTVAANAVTTGGAVVANNIAAASNVVPTVTSPVVNHAPRGRKRKKTPSDALAQAAAVAATAKRVKMEQAATGTTPKKVTFDVSSSPCSLTCTEGSGTWQSCTHLFAWMIVACFLHSVFLERIAINNNCGECYDRERGASDQELLCYFRWQARVWRVR